MNQCAVFLENDINTYFEISKKYCPTVFDEISFYQPDHIPDPPPELLEFRAFSRDKQIDFSDKFFGQQFIKDYLEAKWKAELKNRDCFIRIHSLLADSSDLSVRKAITIKLLQFKNIIINNKFQFKSLQIDFKKFYFDEREANEIIEWE